MSQDFNPACLARQDTERIRRYREMLDFYRGYQWSDRAARGEKHLTLNYARAIIDKITSYLASGLRPTVLPADGTDTAKSKAVRAEAALRQVEQENDLEQLIFETELDCAVLGDACFKVI